MKRKFIFKLKERYDRVRAFYETNEIEVESPAFHESSNLLISGRYQAGVNGKRTAFATIIVRHKHSSRSRRKELKKHFKGNNAGQRARAWLNLMLNNAPDYVDKMGVER